MSSQDSSPPRKAARSKFSFFFSGGNDVDTNADSIVA